MNVAHEPLAFDELGWRQFFDLCAGVLEVDGGVEAGSWVGEEDRDWHVIAPAGLESPAALARRDELILWTEEPLSDELGPEPSPFTDATIRAHVERVLADL